MKLRALKNKSTTAGSSGTRKSKSAKNEAKNPSTKNTLTQFGRDVVTGFEKNAKETAVGLKDAAVGTWKMTAGAVIDRREAARRWRGALHIAKLVAQHPTIIGKAMLDPYVKAWKAGHPGDTVGRAVFEIAMTLGSGAAISHLSKAVAAASPALNFIANSADDIARIASRVSLAAEVVGALEAEEEGKVEE